jgi:WD40 repeat protein
MADVFISYAKADNQERAISFIVEKLTTTTSPIDSDTNITAWFDEQGIRKGEHWEEEIQIGLEQAHTVAIFISPRYFASMVCNQELERAIKLGKKIIPVWIEAINYKTAKEQIQKAIDTRVRQGGDTADIEDAVENYKAIKDKQGIRLDFDTSDDKTQTVDELVNAIFENAKLDDGAAEWLERALAKSRKTGSWLSGNDLKRAESWLLDAENTATFHIHAETREFITSSRRAATVSRSVFAFGIAVVLVVIGVVLTVANNQTNQRNRAEAQRASLSFADSAEAANESGEAFQAISFAMQANLYDDAPDQAKIALANVALQPGVSRIFRENDLATFLFLDDDRMMTNANNDSLLTWNWRTGEQLELMPVGNEILGMEDLQLINNQSRAIHDVRNQIRVFDMTTGEILAMLVPPDGTLREFDVSPDERYVVTSTIFGYAYVWDLESYEMVAELRGHPADTGGTYTAHFISEGEQVLTTGIDGSYVIWDWRHEEQLERFWIDLVLQTVIIEDGGQTMLAGGPTAGLRRIDIETGIMLDEFIEVGKWVDSIVLSNDRSQLAAVTRDNFEAQTFLQIFDATTTDLLDSAPLQYEFIREMEFTPDDRYLVVLPISDTAYLWDFQDPLLESVITVETEVTALAVSPSGELLAIALDNNGIQILDAQSGDMHYQLDGLDEAATFLLFAGEDRLVSTVENTSSEKSLTIWDIENEMITGNITTGIGDSSDIPDMATSPDGRLLALSGESLGETLAIYDILDSPVLVLTQDSAETRGGLSAITFLDDDTLRAIRTSGVADLTLSRGVWSENLFEPPLLFPQPAGNGIWNDTRTLYAVATQTQTLDDGSIDYVTLANGEASSNNFANNISGFAAAPSQSGQAVLGINASGLVIAYTTTPTLMHNYELSAFITAGAFVPGADVAYIAYEDGKIERRVFLSDIDALRTWVKENRYFYQPNCSSLINSNLMTSCTELPENVRVANVPPTLEPIPSPTFLPMGFDVTDTPKPLQATSIPEGTSVAVESGYLNLPFSIIIPDIPGYVASFTEVRTAEDEEDPFMRSIFVPGERTYLVSYDAADGSNDAAILLNIGDSPNVNFDDWFSSLGVVGASGSMFTPEQTRAGLPYALSTDGLSNTVIIFIYDDSHYAFTVDSEVDKDIVVRTIEDTFSDPVAFDRLVDTPSATLNFEIPEVAYQFDMEDDISSLTFVPTIPLSVADYELYNMQIGTPRDANVGMFLDTLFSTQDSFLLLVYSNDPNDQGQTLGDDSLTVDDGILVMQGSSDFTNTIAWYEGDPIMTSLANLLEIGGNTLMNIAIPDSDTSLYLYAENNRFFLIVGNESTQILLRFATQFIQAQ